MFDKLTNKDAMEFIAKVEEPFKNFPHLPKNIIEILVGFAPWFALLGAILGLLFGPVIALLSVFSLLSLNPLVVLFTVVAAILSIVDTILLFMAYTPLKNHQLKGWVYVFWAEMANFVVSILGIFTGSAASAVGSVIGLLIALYVLFEIKSVYKD